MQAYYYTFIAAYGALYYCVTCGTLLRLGLILFVVGLTGLFVSDYTSTIAVEISSSFLAFYGALTWL